ncbi:MAG: alanine racemase [Lachnospiraceae bacterium]|nr:alanine racemase [Lachnospiraceae bacterium]
MEILRDTVIKIDLSAIAQNMRNICQLMEKDTAVAAVVKANAYGHGVLKLAPVLMNSGASLLAVATLEESLEIRSCYPYPVLVMGLTPDSCLHYVIEHDIIQTVDSLHQALLLEKIAARQHKTGTIHLKIDTGFHRIGFPSSENGLEEALSVCRLPHLQTDGIFSHLALLNDETNQLQFDRFQNAVQFLESEGCHFHYKHIADSIALVDYPQYRLNLVRAGALIYGLRGFHKGYVSVRQALTFETKICHISSLKKGEGVSYDYAWRAPEDTRVGTLPFGYADGYPRNLFQKGRVTIHGVSCPIVGVICMDQCMVDLTLVPEARIGDRVIIYGDGTENTLDIQAVSQLAQTNKNEIVSRLSERPRRIYYGL